MTESLSEESVCMLAALDRVTDSIICTNSSGTIAYMNLVAVAVTGVAISQAEGRPLADIFNIVDMEAYRDGGKLVNITIETEIAQYDVNNHGLLRNDGEIREIEYSVVPIHNHDGGLSKVLIIFRDMKSLHSTTERMSYLAQHDYLTGLCNRLALSERFTQAVRLARRHDKHVGLLFIDLDNFKNINDALGHAAGDRVLMMLSRQLEDCVRTSDTVCRYGGDEFVVLLSEMEHPDDAASVARKILSAISVPYVINGHDIRCSLSIGISVYPGDGVDADTLIIKADVAMYRAKSTGKRTHMYFRPGMDRTTVTRRNSAVK